MFIIDQTKNVIENPDPSWGVTPRKLMVKNFATSFKLLAIIAVSLFVTFTPSLAQIPLAESSVFELSIIIAVFSSIGFLFCFAHACSLPKEEATTEAEKRSREWPEEVLLPYIEKKYGIKIQNYTLSLKGRACKDGRYFDFIIRGVNVTYGDLEYNEDASVLNYTIDEEGPWVEEVIVPEKIRTQYVELSPAD